MATEKFIRGKRDDCKHAGLYSHVRRLAEAEDKMREWEQEDMERNRHLSEVYAGEIIPVSDIDPRDYRKAFDGMTNGELALHYTLDLGIYPFEGKTVVKAKEPIELQEGVETFVQEPAVELNYVLFEQ